MINRSRKVGMLGGWGTRERLWKGHSLVHHGGVQCLSLCLSHGYILRDRLDRRLGIGSWLQWIWTLKGKRKMLYQNNHTKYCTEQTLGDKLKQTSMACVQGKIYLKSKRYLVILSQVLLTLADILGGNPGGGLTNLGAPFINGRRLGGNWFTWWPKPIFSKSSTRIGLVTLFGSAETIASSWNIKGPRSSFMQSFERLAHGLDVCHTIYTAHAIPCHKYIKISYYILT